MGDLGVLALFIFGTIIAAGLLLALIFGVICSAQYLFGDLPYSMQNHRIRERIAELKTSGFAPTHQHIFGGGGVAVDGPGKRVFLANGETTKAAAQKFKLSQGRVSQLRRELAESWRRFVGDEPGAAAVAA